VYGSKFQREKLSLFSGKFIYQSRRRHISEDGKLHRHPCEDFISAGTKLLQQNSINNQLDATITIY
jgi:hypothetical protein